MLPVVSGLESVDADLEATAGIEKSAGEKASSIEKKHLIPLLRKSWVNQNSLGREQFPTIYGWPPFTSTEFPTVAF
jgi:hypothetical protein